MLTGGSSSRMGSDKALLEIDGQPIAARMLDVLGRAGAVECLAVGGDSSRLAALGFATVPDDHPGAGPLGGIIAGLRAARCALAVVVACDQPALGPHIVAALVERLVASADSTAVIPLAGGRRQVLAAAYRTSIVPNLARTFASGERSLQRAVDELVVVEVDDLDPRAFVDLDRPEDVRRYHLSRSTGLPTGDPVSAEESSNVDVPEIDVAELRRRQGEGSPVFDVRQPDEYADAHVPGAVLIPLSEVPDRVDEFPGDGPSFVICRSGARSHTASGFLIDQGIDATNVAGGMLAWISAEYPVATGTGPG